MSATSYKSQARAESLSLDQTAEAGILVQEDTVANTDSTNAEGSLARAIWRLELARAKHVLRAYLRTRLLKLEACCAAVLADQSMQTRLSQRELQYAHVSPPPDTICCMHRIMMRP